MKVLVTGGAGFIGSQIVRDLLKIGHKVIVFDNFSTGKKENLPEHENLEIIEGDLQDISFFPNVFEGVYGIIHQAAKISVPESLECPLSYFNTNVNGTIALFENARLHGILRIVFASSCSIYGNLCYDTEEKEWQTTNPCSPYALTKYVDEHLARYYSKYHNMYIIGLRYANVYGPRQEVDGEGAVIPTFITKLLNNESPTIYGDGNAIRDFVYVEDVSSANIDALFTEDLAGHMYNIGTHVETKIIDLYYSIAKKLNKKIEPNFKEKRKGDIERASLNSKKAFFHFDWLPETNLEIGLDKTIKWNLIGYEENNN